MEEKILCKDIDKKILFCLSGFDSISRYSFMYFFIFKNKYYCCNLDTFSDNFIPFKIFDNLFQFMDYIKSLLPYSCFINSDSVEAFYAYAAALKTSEALFSDFAAKCRGKNHE